MGNEIVADIEDSGIYQIRNLTNGKRYIGSAVSIPRRWRQHRSDLGKGRHNPKLQNAWRKHGESAFVFEIIEKVTDNRLLIEREQHYLDLIKPEYNIAVVAGSNLGVKWGEDVKQRMSVANKAVWERPGHREKMSEAHKGYVPTDDQRRKIGEAHKGRKLNPEQALAHAERMRKKNITVEHRQMLSMYWKGRPKTKEQIEKIAATKRGKPAHNRGKPASEEQKAKQSAAMKAKYANDPALRKKISETTRAGMARKRNQPSPA